MIKLSDKFTYKKLLRFTLPSIAMMIFTSIYSVVDGFFISNFTGVTSFAAVNLVIPIIMVLSSIGFMFGAGGSAYVARQMGEGNTQQAKKSFSLIVSTSACVGVFLSVLGIFLIEPIAKLLGAQGELLSEAVLYGRSCMAFLPAFMLQVQFQSFMVTAERPQMGLIVTAAAGVTNMIFDALLVAVLNLGVAGAAVATGASQLVGGLIPLIYFLRPNKSSLRLVKPAFNFRIIAKVCVNGSSEFMSNVSMSVVSMLYNVQLLKYAQQNGVAAYGTLMYVGMIFAAVFMGFSIGSAPVISYHYGAQNKEELKNLRKKGFRIIAVFAVAMFAVSELLAPVLSQIFVGYDQELLTLTREAFVIYSFSFLFMGFAIFSSGFFTALNDGLTSALISFLRTMVFQIASVIILPLILGVTGIWLSIVVAEVMAVTISAVMLILKRKKYGY